MSEPTPVWERQSRESGRAYGAFCAYRDLGPSRSLRAAAAKFYHRGSAAVARQMQSWSAAFRWVERAHAWDQHLDAESRQAQEKARREMGERHAKEAQGLQAKALERMRNLRPEELSPADVLRYFIEAAKLERLALGEPDSLQRQEFTGKGGGPVVLNIIEEVVHAPPTEPPATDGPPAPGPAGVPPQ